MKQFEIADKPDPGSIGQTSCTSTQAWTRSNGDVEMVATLLGGDHRTLIVIPKAKRAALADFLVQSSFDLHLTPGR